MNYIICYDICDDRRRTCLSNELLGYGERVQFSVFQCRLADSELIKLIKVIDQLIDKEEDSVCIYELCARCETQIVRIGTDKKPPEQDFYIV